MESPKGSRRRARCATEGRGRCASDGDAYTEAKGVEMPDFSFDFAIEHLKAGLLDKITECIRYEVEQASRPCGSVEERASGTPRLLEKITECIRQELGQASRPCGGVEERARGTPRNSC